METQLYRQLGRTLPFLDQEWVRTARQISDIIEAKTYPEKSEAEFNGLETLAYAITQFYPNPDNQRRLEGNRDDVDKGNTSSGSPTKKRTQPQRTTKSAHPPYWAASPSTIRKQIAAFKRATIPVLDSELYRYYTAEVNRKSSPKLDDQELPTTPKMPPSQLTEEIRREIGQAIADAMQAYQPRQPDNSIADQLRAALADPGIRENLRGPPGERGEPGEAVEGNPGTRWNAGEVGFFDPNLSTAEYGAGPMVFKGDKTYFRDVHLFIDRAKDVGALRGWQMVKDNLWTCLRGTALAWYTSELSDEAKRLFKLEDKINNWEDSLFKRFKKPTTEAMHQLTEARYTVDDARRRRDPRELAQAVIRNCKDVGFVDTLQQISLIYNGIDYELRRDLQRPKDGTPLETFMRDLDLCKEGWFEAHSRRREMVTQPRQGQYDSGPTRNVFPQRGRGQYGGPRRGGYYQGRPFLNSNPIPRYSAFTYPNQYQQSYGQARQGNYQGYNQNQGAGDPARQQFMLPAPSAAGQKLLMPPPPKPGETSFPNRPNGQGPRFYRKPFGQVANQRRQPQMQQAYFGDENQENMGHYGEYYEQEQSDGNWPMDSAYGYGEYEYEGTLSADESKGQGNENSGYYETSRQVDEYNQSDKQTGGNAEETEAFYTSAVLGTNQKCETCSCSFPSKNMLHRHLREHRHATRHPLITETTTEALFTSATALVIADLPIVRSQATSDRRHGYGFRSWKYATVKASLKIDTPPCDMVVDTGCTMSLIDRDFLNTHLPNLKLRRLTEAITVRGIGAGKHESTEFARVYLYIPGHVGKERVKAQLIRDLHVVNDLRVKVLLGMDILGPEAIDVRISTSTLTIGSCKNMTAPIEVKPRAASVKQKVRTTDDVTVPPHATRAVGVSFGDTQLSEDMDYIFEPTGHNFKLGKEGGVTAHLVDAQFSRIHVTNTTDHDVEIQKHTFIGRLRDIKEEGCYAASPDMEMLSRREAEKLDGEQVLDENEERMRNGITVYGSNEQRKALARIAHTHASLFEDRGQIANIPEENWMTIPLKSDAKPDPHRVYPLGKPDQEFVDKEFDKLQMEGKLEWTKKPTEHSYPVFVVWRTVRNSKGEDERKGRVVVDIRGLNRDTIVDTYPVPLQSDIINEIQGCRYISLADATRFFYQFRTREQDRDKITVVSHRGQEQFNVAIMGYKNSIPYVQRIIDGILRPFRKFARAYIDDVVIFSRTLEEHILHLDQIFRRFKDYNLGLSPTKTYLGYPSVPLLGKKVDAFGLSTPKDKLEAITKLKFPQTLTQLEAYIGLTG